MILFLTERIVWSINRESKVDKNSMKKKEKLRCQTMILNVRTAIKALRLEQLSKRWKKARYPVPNVIAGISRGFLMAAGSAPEKLHLR